MSSWTDRILALKGNGKVQFDVFVYRPVDYRCIEIWQRFSTGWWRRYTGWYGKSGIVGHRAIARRHKKYVLENYKFVVRRRYDGQVRGDKVDRRWYPGVTRPGCYEVSPGSWRSPVRHVDGRVGFTTLWESDPPGSVCPGCGERVVTTEDRAAQLREQQRARAAALHLPANVTDIRGSDDRGVRDGHSGVVQLADVRCPRCGSDYLFADYRTGCFIEIELRAGKEISWDWVHEKHTVDCEASMTCNDCEYEWEVEARRNG